MVQAAASKLTKNAEFINSLNVFPVPDGDTGTNMSLSLASGEKYVNQEVSDNVGDLANALAKGLLMGARGNSGVILSQIFRGFSKSTNGKETLGAQDLADAFVSATETAYKSVMKPTEGTILTVIRLAAQAGKETAATTDDIIEVMDAIYSNAKTALAKTPDLLPVLKQVGVVDSGGQGLTFVLEAFDDILNGRTVESDDLHQPNDAEMTEMIDATHHQSVQSKLDPDDIVYGYCTEIMVRIGKGKQVDHSFDYQTFYDYLADLGDSLLVVNDEEIVKVHVHTEHPGKVIAWGQEFGDLAKVKVDNMRLQQETIIEQDQDAEDNVEVANQQPKETAVIAIASGDGLTKLFESMGVSEVLSGGQTMNPATEDFVNIVKSCNAKNIFILPNNSNIILAASQACDVCENANVRVIPSKSIPQGLVACMMFNPETDADENYEQMCEALSNVTTGQVTFAIKDTVIDGVEIKKDEFMGMKNKEIICCVKDKFEAAHTLLDSMLDEMSSIVTIIYGDDVSDEDANAFVEKIASEHEDLDIDVRKGGQPVYSFIIGVE